MLGTSENFEVLANRMETALSRAEAAQSELQALLGSGAGAGMELDTLADRCANVLQGIRAAEREGHVAGLARRTAEDAAKLETEFQVEPRIWFGRDLAFPVLNSQAAR